MIKEGETQDTQSFSSRLLSEVKTEGKRAWLQIGEPITKRLLEIFPEEPGGSRNGKYLSDPNAPLLAQPEIHENGGKSDLQLIREALQPYAKDFKTEVIQPFADLLKPITKRLRYPYIENLPVDESAKMLIFAPNAKLARAYLGTINRPGQVLVVRNYKKGVSLLQEHPEIRRIFIRSRANRNFEAESDGIFNVIREAKKRGFSRAQILLAVPSYSPEADTQGYVTICDVCNNEEIDSYLGNTSWSNEYIPKPVAPPVRTRSRERLRLQETLSSLPKRVTSILTETGLLSKEAGEAPTVYSGNPNFGDVQLQPITESRGNILLIADTITAMGFRKLVPRSLQRFVVEAREISKTYEILENPEIHVGIVLVRCQTYDDIKIGSILDKLALKRVNPMHILILSDSAPLPESRDLIRVSYEGFERIEVLVAHRDRSDLAKFLFQGFILSKNTRLTLPHFRVRNVGEPYIVQRALTKIDVASQEGWTAGDKK